MHAELGELDYLRKLAGKLATAAHGGKGELVDAAAQFLRISKAEVYRRLEEKVGYKSGRKPRVDRGKTSVPEEIARKAAGMVHVAMRANGKKTLAIKDALEILQADGHCTVDTETGEITSIDVSATTLARAMRLYNCHPEQLRAPRASVSMQSLHPNHVWQIDASVCVLFYLPKGGLQVMEEKEFYKNKPQNIKRIENDRVIRYVVTDHFSGDFYLEYVTGAEDAANLTQCFLNSIQKRGADDPMHGVPLILMMDKGSANLSGLFLNLLDRLKVQHIEHLPGNPRAKGQVEKTQDIVECKFESRLSFQRVNNLDELNQLANRWRLYFNANARHSRHGMTRNAMWLHIREEQLRLAPPLELCRELVTTRPVEVTVRSNLSVSYSIKGYGQNDYDVRYIPGVMPKQKLQVVVNPYRAPSIDVLLQDEQGQEIAYTLEPMQKTLAGFNVDDPVFGQSYRQPADSAVDQARKDIRKEAYNAETELEVDAKRKAKAPAYEGQLNAFADVDRGEVPQYIPRRGRDLGLEARNRELQPLNHVDAAKHFKGRLGDAWKPEFFQWLQQRYPDGVPQDQLDAIETEMVGPAKEFKQPLRVVKTA
ncbi:DDE-type integrase/transposase/recombinase [Laribacter hongkongensis]|uniref:DDE-type integrase/transposase/recombinase n=1 Tax=Laribacter hongkongensis TaxID=168471 RepID=UPI001EFEBCB8|nr:DDE-type integrase/transposase/recombinase [Laribacter hongkongensis]MCG8991474.1 DDE-type integrase/transposase/recombinase [Laribacter hongkongensis]MCG8997730.1 DDE-type integrase/transposase/recombinase [Laribacter hongkongensis]MCG9001244.1 DDE-type integrase/transposase/recombinase [Laribacter hongkongensis]MCG9003060.1 DDE-type integrase/transposase/recombinase [Laribacter hongkongensis]MCG9007452.1 DDE-type integrase/transposase/recombinase [Laribacter hongkongensis]